MKKIISILLLSLIFISCDINTKGYETSRFKLVQSTDWCDVVVDTETGVEYAVSVGRYNYGDFTLLVDANGNPLIYKEVTK